MSPTTSELIDTSLEAKCQNLEELLQESEERFRLIAETTPVMLSLIDSHHNYEYCNTVQREFIGHSLERQLDRVWFQGIHPEDRQQYQKKYDAAFDAQEKFQLEYRCRRADGEYRWVIETGMPRFTSNNNFVGYVCSCLDITEDNTRQNIIDWCKEQWQNKLFDNKQVLQKKSTKTENESTFVEQRIKAVDVGGSLPNSDISSLTAIMLRESTEEALQASEARLRIAISAAQMGVWDWDIEKESVTYSEREEAIFGFAPGDFNRTYQAFFNRIHSEDRNRVNQANKNTIKNGDEYDIDYRIIWQDNTVHWLREKGAVLRNEMGKAVRMLGITMDITESKQVEESLQQSKECYRKLAQQKELLYRISNQIRNSLDLDTILETAVEEIRNLLQIEHCLFIWHRLNGEAVTWEVMYETKPTNLPSLLGSYPVEVSVEFLSVDASLEKLFQALGYEDIRNLPIQTLNGEFGVIVCLNSNSCQLWSDEEIELLSCVCNQLAIAINQSQLYTKSHAAATISTQKATQLEQVLHSLQQTQSQLIQTEKMSSLGQLIAGLAHEINNPISFIYGNISYADKYIQDLLCILKLYQTAYPKPVPNIKRLEEEIDLSFLVEDLPKILDSMKVGATRIRDLVLSLRNFSRLDEAEKKTVDLHEGLNSTSLILQHRLKPQAGFSGIQIIKEYGKLPLVNCYPSQLNQVFMNLLTNAIDALDSVENPMIRICTQIDDLGCIIIRIADNGFGMTEAVISRLFDPFFTTKPIGKGTGLGLSISYQIIVEKHKGTIQCYSEVGKGTEFVITLPR
jgi:PAS domain S-box-containing protein